MENGNAKRPADEWNDIEEFSKRLCAIGEVSNVCHCGSTHVRSCPRTKRVLYDVLESYFLEMGEYKVFQFMEVAQYAAFSGALKTNEAVNKCALCTFAEGLHSRMGTASPVVIIDQLVVSIIVDWVQHPYKFECVRTCTGVWTSADGWV